MPQINSVRNRSSQLQPAEPAPTQFRVASINEGQCSLSSYNRRDFYKITLVTNGCSQLLYADKDIEVNKSALVFTNPMVPYSWDSEDPLPEGYFCVFTDRFLQAGNHLECLEETTFFKPGGHPVYLLNDEQVNYLTGIFRRMREEIDSEYVFKYDLLRNQVQLIMHEALKMQPAVAFYNPPNAASRITKLFLGLLDKQFPVESPQHLLPLKKAGDYAEKLAVHVNHLNAAVQEITGKSTTTHINERTLAEAKSLLTHTDWTIAEIAYSLGFEYPSYFNNFFKKHTSMTPSGIRNGKVIV